MELWPSRRRWIAIPMSTRNYNNGNCSKIKSGGPDVPSHNITITVTIRHHYMSCKSGLNGDTTASGERERSSFVLRYKNPQSQRSYWLTAPQTPVGVARLAGAFWEL